MLLFYARGNWPKVPYKIDNKLLLERRSKSTSSCSSMNIKVKDGSSPVGGDFINNL